MPVSAILRFDGGVRHEHAIDAWFHTHADELDALARPWFERMRRCGDDVRELLHDHHPTACVGDAAFAYVNVFSAHVNVGFFHGADLDDPKGLLVGTGKRMRHVKLHPGVPVDEAALAALIRAAYVDIRRRARE
ncbi:MAG TPA: DUF1801 domain-containing protein [Gammaproteobacteria bacterium]|nr:DUF1801 domain-containing protein [Gammaproteobacteria bacterium]